MIKLNWIRTYEGKWIDLGKAFEISVDEDYPEIYVRAWFPLTLNKKHGLSSEKMEETIGVDIKKFGDKEEAQKYLDELMEKQHIS